MHRPLSFSCDSNLIPEKGACESCRVELYSEVCEPCNKKMDAGCYDWHMKWMYGKGEGKGLREGHYIEELSKNKRDLLVEFPKGYQNMNIDIIRDKSVEEGLDPEAAVQRVLAHYSRRS